MSPFWVVDSLLHAQHTPVRATGEQKGWTGFIWLGMQSSAASGMLSQGCQCSKKGQGSLQCRQYMHNPTGFTGAESADQAKLLGLPIQIAELCCGWCLQRPCHGGDGLLHACLVTLSWRCAEARSARALVALAAVSWSSCLPATRRPARESISLLLACAPMHAVDNQECDREHPEGEDFLRCICNGPYQMFCAITMATA